MVNFGHPAIEQNFAAVELQESGRGSVSAEVQNFRDVQFHSKIFIQKLTY
jgi:hypothetical protein